MAENVCSSEEFYENPNVFASNEYSDSIDTKEEEAEYDEDVAGGVSLITDASNEYFTNDGKLSEETMSKFGEMSSQELVNAYMAIQENTPQPEGRAYPSLSTDGAVDLTPKY